MGSIWKKNNLTEPENSIIHAKMGTIWKKNNLTEPENGIIHAKMGSVTSCSLLVCQISSKEEVNLCVKSKVGKHVTRVLQ